MIQGSLSLLVTWEKFVDGERQSVAMEGVSWKNRDGSDTSSRGKKSGGAEIDKHFTSMVAIWALCVARGG